MKIILGSKSHWRKRMLEEMGFEVQPMASDIDEKKIRHENPEHLALRLANAKADALLPQIHETALLVTLDSLAVWKGEIREKPESEHEARQFLKDYSEYPVLSVTGVVVVNTETGARKEGIDLARTFFKPLSDEAVDALIADGCVFGCAGGFCVQHPLFEPWVDHIEGEKESVAGLPVTLTKRLIAEMNQI